MPADARGQRPASASRGTYHGLMWISRPRVRSLAFSVLLAATTLVYTGVTTSAEQPLAIRPPTLVIVAPPSLEPAAEGLRQLDTQKLITVMRLLGLNDAGPPITVTLVPEDGPVARQAPSWVAGFAIADASQIVIFPARTPSYPYDSMESLLHHEVTHVLVGRAAPGANIPRWFHEGLAMALERTWGLRDHSEAAMAVVLGEGSLATLDDDFRGGPASAARAYGVAGAFVRDLIGRHGAGFPARLLASLAGGAPFDDAFRVATSTTLAEAERLFWRDSWWYRVVPFLTSSLVLWMVIVLLAISARRRRAMRRRVLRERWEAEERDAAAAAAAAQGPDMHF